MTRGVKEPCSISITRCLYLAFFIFSLESNAVLTQNFRWVLAKTSKKTIAPSCQKPLAAISSLAYSSLLAALGSVWPVRVSNIEAQFSRPMPSDPKTIMPFVNKSIISILYRSAQPNITYLSFIKSKKGESENRHDLGITIFSIWVHEVIWATKFSTR